MSARTRPVGVTIIAILEIVSGAIAIAVGAFFGTMMGSMGMNLGGGAMGAGSAAMIVLGVASFVMAWGLLRGKSWAWTITLILTIISLIVDLPSMNVIGLIIDIVILYYLFRPHVKAYFGKGSAVL
ncbi:MULTISPECIES: hypothetical protein [Nitrosopumilus]|uniref:hypothetical protein n=1 Tax=Nitrosopumilus TaxID=338191 RepID=UPI001E413AE9|nr:MULTISPECIES: hypothetical protein [Nitrosopumilus]